MRKYVWRVALFAWLLLIFFSSATVAIGWCGRVFQRVVTFVFSGLPRDPQVYSNLFFVAEKSVHLILFAFLGILLWWNLPDAPWKFRAIVSTGLTVGIASELFQKLFPGRDPTVRDVILNVAGTTLGAVISPWLSKKVLVKKVAAKPKAAAAPVLSRATSRPPRPRKRRPASKRARTRSRVRVKLPK